jgi:flagellar motility protein MotE (MotC chaperone)
MLETLKEIRRKEEDLKSLENLKSELKKSRQVNENLNKIIKWNETHIHILSHALGQKICSDCG